MDEINLRTSGSHNTTNPLLLVAKQIMWNANRWILPHYLSRSRSGRNRRPPAGRRENRRSPVRANGAQVAMEGHGTIFKYRWFFSLLGRFRNFTFIFYFFCNLLLYLLVAPSEYGFLTFVKRKLQSESIWQICKGEYT